MLRQKTIIFSSFILPLVIIWSTWWVTADIPMEFKLFNNRSTINASMIDVHVVTGGLTAMALTSGLFAFILTVENLNISERLKLAGYSNATINLASFMALLLVLIITSIIAIILSVNLSNPEDWKGIAMAIFLVTLIYAALGNLIASIYPKITEGTLFVLVFSFMDLMLLTSPMGEGLYLQNWTYFLPGFWPVQLSLESGFVGFPSNIWKLVVFSIFYFIVLIFVTQLVKSNIFTSLARSNVQKVKQ